MNTSSLKLTRYGTTGLLVALMLFSTCMARSRLVAGRSNLQGTLFLGTCLLALVCDLLLARAINSRELAARSKG